MICWNNDAFNLVILLKDETATHFGFIVRGQDVIHVVAVPSLGLK